MKIISKLPQLMEKRGISQRGLAVATGVTPNTIRKICRSRFDQLDMPTVKKLCIFFDVQTLCDLIEIEREPEDELGLEQGWLDS